MDGNGFKVTIIETQFVTSDAASFKSVVQRLTGKSADDAAPARPLHRPRSSRAGAGADGRCVAGETRRCYASSTSAGSAAFTVNAGGAAGRATTPCLEELHEICDFSELLYVGAIDWRHGGGSYNGFPY